MRKLIHFRRCLKLTIILWRLRWPCTMCFHIMWWGRNIRNIRTTIKYLILPLATADYDEHALDIPMFIQILLLSLSIFQQCSAKQNFSNQHPNEVFSRNPNNNVWLGKQRLTKAILAENCWLLQKIFNNWFFLSHPIYLSRLNLHSDFWTISSKYTS